MTGELPSDWLFSKFYVDTKKAGFKHFLTPFLEYAFDMCVGDLHVCVPAFLMHVPRAVFTTAGLADARSSCGVHHSRPC